LCGTGRSCLQPEPDHCRQACSGKPPAQFKKQKTGSSEPMEAKVPSIDEETRNAIVKQLVEALVNYFLQIMK
ncbi:hypothetical protein ACTXQV_49755, partial [Klebsiella pneumoniae]